ncbi:MAG: hypothetical protein ACREA2_19885 [Blastocatellia bacterium]
MEKQLQTLHDCGIRLAPGITIDHLLASYDREDYEAKPFLHLLAVMGGELEEEPFVYLSNDIWHFDTECIENHDDYARIAGRMRDLAGSALPLAEINDYVDVVEEEKAWLSFKLNGVETRWEAEVDNDWVDPQVFSMFADLLAKQPTDKRYTYFDLKGQDCLIGCSTPKQLKRLRKETGLDFQWLS